MSDQTFDILKIFKPELTYIVSDKIREFTIAALKHYGNQFFDTPSTTSGEHHPTDEWAGTGFILHCKRVAWWSYMLCVEHNLREELFDCMIAASLLHDIGRLDYIKKTGKNQFHRAHGINGWRMISTQVPEFVEFERSEIIKSLQIIQGMIETHMSHWDSHFGGKPTKYLYEYLFATADYCASRPEIDTPTLTRLPTRWNKDEQTK